MENNSLSILNFGDPESRLIQPLVPIEKTVEDAVSIVRANKGISADSLDDAIATIFIEGSFSYSLIVSEINKVTGKKRPDWSVLKTDRQMSLLSQRQQRYFQGGMANAYASQVSTGYTAFEATVDSDVEQDLEMAGLGKDKLLGVLSNLIYDEDSKVALRAVETALSLSGISKVAGVHAERKKSMDKAKIRLQAKMLEKAGGGDALNDFEAAALEAYRRRKQKREDAQIVDAEVVSQSPTALENIGE